MVWEGALSSFPGVAFPAEACAHSTHVVLPWSPGACVIFCSETIKFLRCLCGTWAKGAMFPQCAQVCSVPAGTATCPEEVLVSESWGGVWGEVMLRTPCHSRKGRISHKVSSVTQHLFMDGNSLVYRIPLSGWIWLWSKTVFEQRTELSSGTFSSATPSFLSPYWLCKIRSKIWKLLLNYFCCVKQQSDLFIAQCGKEIW